MPAKPVVVDNRKALILTTLGPRDWNGNNITDDIAGVVERFGESMCPGQTCERRQDHGRYD